ncbi:serine/threonine-protein kinase [Acrocarpospora sp. B8E8]|uniref:serine/threonine-protein kinase n=1 Tax=Acrocarpospora sp. B8E8 TaxID=3153572 RepID=UPI00325F7A67
MEGERLVAGRYQLKRKLGQGAMGVVWEGHDTLLDRPVAVKEVMLPLGLPPGDLERQLLRTGREARTAARLSHRSIVAIYDVAEEDGRPWIVMELVRAPSLEQLVREQGSLPVREVAAIGRQILSALATAHAAGVLHRDVKPANILVTPEGRAVLTDFGIATTEHETNLPVVGMITGSPAFLAPERAEALEFGPPSDLWSLGATLYAAVLGKSPFDRGTMIATVAAVLTEEPDFGRLHPALHPALSALLKRDPAERASVAEAERLLSLVDGGPPREPGSRWRSRTWLVAVAAVAMVAVIGTAAWSMMSLDPPAAPVIVSPSPSPSPEPSVTPTRVSSFKRYASPAGWTIGYPRTWTGSRAEAFTEWLSRDGGSHLGVEEVVPHAAQREMIAEIEAIRARDARDYRRVRLDRVSWSYGGAVEWESTFTPVDTASSPWLTAGVGYRELTRLLTVGDRAFLITWTSEEARWAAQTEAMTKVLDSFRPR